MAPAPVLLFLGACVLVRQGSPTADLEDELRQADRLVAGRAEEDRLGKALEILRRLDARSPGDPEVLGRLSWVLYLRDEALPEDGARRWEEGIAVGWACLDNARAFSAALDRNRGRVTDAVAGRIPTSHATCALGLVAGWSRRVQASGPAALAIDLDPLRALADRAEALLANTPEAAEAGRLAVRVRLLVPPVLGGNPARDGARLAEICGPDPAADPGCLVDLAVLAWGPSGDQARWAEALTRAALAPSHPEPPEWARARQQARDLLSSSETRED
ncbi:MAG: hypothetical protein JXB39_06460 [Deltaproteobacteria bacterium]|nr:hypothetical protein [Deltaproteobacteria bacterium]